MSASTFRWRAATAAASASVLLVLAGCAAGAPPESVGSATSTSTASPTCWSGLGASTETVPRPSPIQVVLLGSGTRTVVFSNQSDADLCGWLPFAKTLVDKGLRVALYNYTGGVDQDLVAVVEHLRAEGATSIAVLGGSEGAKASIVAAAKLDPQPAALVSLSPEAAIQRVPVAPSAAQVRCPALFVTGDDDGYGSTPATKNFYAVSPSTDKKLLVIPGKQHGVELLSRPAVSGAVIDFLTAHLG